jgi:hypothetical protein
MNLFFHHKIILDVGPSSDPRISHGSEWTNYPLMSNINHQSSDPSASSNGMIDDNSLDTF